MMYSSTSRFSSAVALLVEVDDGRNVARDASLEEIADLHGSPIDTGAVVAVRREDAHEGEPRLADDFARVEEDDGDTLRVCPATCLRSAEVRKNGYSAPARPRKMTVRSVLMLGEDLLDPIAQ